MLDAADMNAAVLFMHGQPASVSGGTLDVVFGEEWVEALGIEGYRPVAQARLSDVQALGVVSGSTIVIDTKPYTVRIPKRETGDWVRLVLEEV